MADAALKTCSKCLVVKPAADFYRDKRRGDRLRHSCKMCHISQSKTREESLWQDPQWRNRRKEISKRWRRNNIEKRLISGAKQRAIAQGVPFNLSVHDVVLPLACPVLGTTFAISDGSGSCDESPTLDRLIPEFGYVIGNVTVMSAKANRIKSNATIPEIEAVLTWLKLNS